MAVWKGGRGVKAPYESTHVRVPVPIKEEVEKLIEKFKSGDKEEEKQLPSLEESVEIARVILNQKKSARVSVEKLLTGIYGVEVSL